MIIFLICPLGSSGFIFASACLRRNSRTAFTSKIVFISAVIDYLIHPSKCFFNSAAFVSFMFCVLNHRKKKAVHKTTTTDDKRLQSTLKRIGVNAIPAIEEVNIFKDDVVIQFQNPKGKICWSCNISV